MLAPYERGTGAGRQVKTQREADLEALDLAGRKGVMLDELAALAEGDRLDSASRMRAEWFAEQVRTASTGGRLDDLAALFAEAGMHRRWWQRPAKITAGYADDDSEDDGQADQPAALMLAAPAGSAGQQRCAPPHRMTWAEAIAACGWHLSPTAGGCQLVDERGLCGAETMHHIGNAWLCSPHYTTLGGMITSDYYRRSA